jgi:hypothetical protein
MMEAGWSSHCLDEQQNFFSCLIVSASFSTHEN